MPWGRGEEKPEGKVGMCSSETLSRRGSGEVGF